MLSRGAIFRSPETLRPQGEQPSAVQVEVYQGEGRQQPFVILLQAPVTHPSKSKHALQNAEGPFHLGSYFSQLLAAVHASSDERRFPIAVIADEGIPEWRERLAEGVIENIFPRNLPPFHWETQVEMVLGMFRCGRELEHLRATTALLRDIDSLTGLSNRTAFLSMLFRETDRVQRMNTFLSVMRFDIDDARHWIGRLGEATWDAVVKETVGRVQRFLRTYDLFGRVGSDGFVLGLPGCAPVNAVSLAERIRLEVFSVPFRAEGPAVRLTASYGIAPSHGRSPLIVIREAEEALQAAKVSGPEEIRTARDWGQPRPPAALLSASSREDLLIS